MAIVSPSWVWTAGSDVAVALGLQTVVIAAVLAPRSASPTAPPAPPRPEVSPLGMFLVVGAMLSLPAGHRADGAAGPVPLRSAPRSASRPSSPSWPCAWSSASARTAGSPRTSSAARRTSAASSSPAPTASRSWTATSSCCSPRRPPATCSASTAPTDDDRGQPARPRRPRGPRAVRSTRSSIPAGDGPPLHFRVRQRGRRPARGRGHLHRAPRQRPPRALPARRHQAPPPRARARAHGLHRPPDRAAQPRDAVPGDGRAVASSSAACWCSTSTGSRPSTTSPGTRPATSCWSRWPAGCTPSSARTTWSPASAATSSPSWSPARSSRPRTSPSASSTSSACRTAPASGPSPSAPASVSPSSAPPAASSPSARPTRRCARPRRPARAACAWRTHEVVPPRRPGRRPRGRRRRGRAAAAARRRLRRRRAGSHSCTPSRCGSTPCTARVRGLELWSAAERQGRSAALQRWLLRPGLPRRSRAWTTTASPSSSACPPGTSTPEGLAAEVADALDGSGLAPSRLALSFTEETLLTSSAALVPELEADAATGVRLCLDNYGMGHSIFALLARVPLDVVRVDLAGAGPPRRHRAGPAGAEHDRAHRDQLRAWSPSPAASRTPELREAVVGHRGGPDARPHRAARPHRRGARRRSSPAADPVPAA